jgi:hypothetical protein
MKNKTKGESPDKMKTPKDIRKVKEAVREIIPAHRQVKGRPRDTRQNDSVVVCDFYTFPL